MTDTELMYSGQQMVLNPFRIRAAFERKNCQRPISYLLTWQTSVYPLNLNIRIQNFPD